MHSHNINILYLAQYAPMNGKKITPQNEVDTVYAEYHWRIFSILSNLFSNTRASNDPEILFKKNIKVDYIFSLYNRMPFKNSEIFISSIAEYLKIPYLGAPPNIRALAEDKHLGKMMARYAKVPTPDWKIYNIGSRITPPSFNGPYFIKPRFGAASDGINVNSVASDWNAAHRQILHLHAINQDVILEKYINGVYCTSPVLQNYEKNMFLPCISQLSDLPNGVITHEQKRKAQGGLKREVLTDKFIESTIHEFSKRMFDLIQPLDYTRFDYMVEESTGIPFFLEFNVCCNLGEHSTVSQSARNIGIQYDELIENIVFSSLHRTGVLKNIYRKQF